MPQSGNNVLPPKRRPSENDCRDALAAGAVIDALRARLAQVQGAR